MTDFSSLQIKVNDLKAKVTQNSITPAYLGALLDDFIKQMQSIDMTDFSDDIRKAISNARTAIENAQSALSIANSAESSASSALNKATIAIESASNALQKSTSAVSIASAAQSTAERATETAEDVQGRVGRVEGMLGRPGGLATLNERGIVPESQLPEPTEQRVLSFAGIERGTPSILQSTVTGEGSVVFVEQFKTFAFRQGMKASLYANWSGADDYGPAVYATGRSPMAGRIYADSSTGVCYTWDGENLVNRGDEAYRAMQSQLDGYSLRYLTAAENEAMAAAGTFDPKPIYCIEEEG